MGRKTSRWQPFNWGDYLRDTTHLNATEHGAYLLLIGRYWISGGPLPDDDDSLRRTARVDHRKTWKLVRSKIEKFFTAKDGFWHHARVDRDLADAAQRHEKASLAGTRGNKKRWGEVSPERSRGDRLATSKRSLGGRHITVDKDIEALKEKDTGPALPEPGLSAGFAEAFTVWVATLPEAARHNVRPTKQRSEKYRARRKEGYAHKTILDALTNYVHDTWSERLRSARAYDMATLLRDGGQVEKFAAMRPPRQQGCFTIYEVTPDSVRLSRLSYLEEINPLPPDLNEILVGLLKAATTQEELDTAWFDKRWWNKLRP